MIVKICISHLHLCIFYLNQSVNFFHRRTFNFLWVFLGHLSERIYLLISLSQIREILITLTKNRSARLSWLSLLSMSSILINAFLFHFWRPLRESWWGREQWHWQTQTQNLCENHDEVESSEAVVLHLLLERLSVVLLRKSLCFLFFVNTFRPRK